jgi:hypothetical protein
MFYFPIWQGDCRNGFRSGEAIISSSSVRFSTCADAAITIGVVMFILVQRKQVAHVSEEGVPQTTQPGAAASTEQHGHP